MFQENEFVYSLRNDNFYCMFSCFLFLVLQNCSLACLFLWKCFVKNYGSFLMRILSRRVLCGSSQMCHKFFSFLINIPGCATVHESCQKYTQHTGNSKNKCQNISICHCYLSLITKSTWLKVKQTNLNNSIKWKGLIWDLL